MKHFVRLSILIAVFSIQMNSGMAKERFEVRDPAFQTLLEATEALLEDVFDKEFRRAALLSTDDPEERAIISQVEFIVDPSACRLAPEAIVRKPADSGPPQVVMGRVFLVAHLYVTQAIWFELLGGFEPGAVERLERYIQAVVGQSRRVITIRCLHDAPAGPLGDPIVAYPAFIAGSPEGYAELLEKFGTDPAALALGDQLGMSLAFVLMHEVAHHALGHALVGRAARAEDETAADDFAVRVARAGRKSTTLGLGAFLTFVEAQAQARPTESIECRVVRMLVNDDMLAEALSEVLRWPDVPVDISNFRPSVERMREEFLAGYTYRCGR